MVALRFLATILTYLIALCGIVPLFPWLSGLPRVVIAAGLIVGLWQDRKGVWYLKPWMQNVATVPVFLYYALQFNRNNPIQPVVSVLIIMLAVRVSGEKTVRHSLQIYALSIFCLASSSLFDLSPVFLIYLGLLLLMVALALVLLTFQNQDSDMKVTKHDLKKILLSALLMPVLAVPFLLVFFPIMPRTQLPLWHFLNQPASRTTGYSDIVEPGSQSSISESRTLAFRAEMPSVVQNRLYWRGTVFNRTDGIKWVRDLQVPAEQPLTADRNLTQVIYPEPSANRTLITLDRPLTVTLRQVKRSPDGVFEYIGKTGSRLSYTANSQSRGLVPLRNSIDTTFYLQLPDKLPARIMDLAVEIVHGGNDDRDRVQFLENYFRNGGYRYSTTELATGGSALELFLFEKKQGNCEFFASSFALLLRTAGVPCRLVGGYLGGEYNEVGGYYLVGNDKAHVWVEVYINESGWIRIDPSSFATNAGDVWMAHGSKSLMLRISMFMDSLNHAWNRFIITYDFAQQMKITTNIGSHLQISNLLMILRSSMSYIVAVLLVGILFVARKSSLFLSRERRILNRFFNVVAREFNISTGEGVVGLFEIASLVDNNHVSDFVAIYAGALYRDRKLADYEYLRLCQIIKVLKSDKSEIS